MTCELCGEPLPLGETMFKYHGYSGPCPKPPKAKEVKPLFTFDVSLRTPLEVQDMCNAKAAALSEKVAELELLRKENERLFNENALLKGEVAGLKAALDLVKGSRQSALEKNAQLKARLREAEDALKTLRDKPHLEQSEHPACMAIERTMGDKRYFEFGPPRTNGWEGWYREHLKMVSEFARAYFQKHGGENA